VRKRVDLVRGMLVRGRTNFRNMLSTERAAWARAHGPRPMGPIVPWALGPSALGPWAHGPKGPRAHEPWAHAPWVQGPWAHGFWAHGPVLGAKERHYRPKNSFRSMQMGADSAGSEATVAIKRFAYSYQACI